MGEAYLYLMKCNIGQSHASCKICHTYFSVSNGRKSDFEPARQIWQHAPPMTEFITINFSEADQVTKTENVIAPGAGKFPLFSNPNDDRYDLSPLCSKKRLNRSDPVRYNLIMY